MEAKYRKSLKGKNFRTIGFAFLAGLFVFAFQNCSNISLPKSMPLISSKVSQGNGESYDGKLNAGFSRLVPSFTCSDNQVAMGTLEINGDVANLITVENSCQNISTSIPLTHLEFSDISKKYIGYNGAVYTYLENRAESINKGLFTEAWCKTNQSTPAPRKNVELAIEWQEAGKTARIFFLTQDTPNPTALTAIRAIDAVAVSYSTPKGTLKIDLNNLNPTNKKARGTFSGMVDSAGSVEVECLMGGQFDPIAPKFSYSGLAHQTFVVGDRVELAPVINKPAARFSISDLLPSGLTFSSSTGEILGTPRVPFVRQKLFVTAQFDFGEVVRPISIGVGLSQVVDKIRVDSSAIACLDPAGNCDLAGAIAKAIRVAPLPLVIKTTIPLIDLGGIHLTIQGGDIAIVGMNGKTTIDAHAESRHFNVTNFSHLEIQNLNLINGKAGMGGSIQLENSSLSVKNSIFRGNTADDGVSKGRGGALFVTEGELDVLGTEFINNKTRQGGENLSGGAIYIYGGRGSTIKSSKFQNNFCPFGGAIAVESTRAGGLEIRESLFESNSSIQGGALNIWNTTVSISKSQFRANRAATDGGAIYARSSSEAWVSESVFEANSNGNGFGAGAIFWGGPSQGFLGKDLALYILESQFLNQEAAGPFSAAILIRSGKVYMRGSSVTNAGATKGCASMLSAANTTFFSGGGNNSTDGSCPP